MMATAYSPAVLIKGKDMEKIYSNQKKANMNSNLIQKKAKDRLKQFGLEF